MCGCWHLVGEDRIHFGFLATQVLFPFQFCLPHLNDLSFPHVLFTRWVTSSLSGSVSMFHGYLTLSTSLFSVSCLFMAYTFILKLKYVKLFIHFALSFGFFFFLYLQPSGKIRVRNHHSASFLNLRKPVCASASPKSWNTIMGSSSTKSETLNVLMMKT